MCWPTYLATRKHLSYISLPEGFFSVTASVPCQTKGEKIFKIFWDLRLPLSLQVYNLMALNVGGEKKGDKSCGIQLDLPTNTWTGEREGEGKLSSFPRGLGRRSHRTPGIWRKQHSIRWPYVNDSPWLSQSSWPASCSNLRDLRCDFQVPDLGKAIQMLSPVRSD